MKLITRDTDYAIRAIACIAGNKGKVTTVGALSEKLHMPRPFLRKLLQVLNKKGVLSSQKGKGGGFMLVVPIEDIKLTDIMEIFQGPFRLNEHVFKKRACPNVCECALKKKIDEIESRVYEELRAIDLGVMIFVNGKSLRSV
ncbi:MAG TPA: Rrf2 family transcriptional regulator [Candidatus Omnitrophota bacterium]|nr:Rrf2 family transcriptional regulator [Candidatus Omnitrophota bacterium]HPS20348.1 Rrf2 family transcriptional regulator [Candidatus Omnitrophota bacterium]